MKLIEFKEMINNIPAIHNERQVLFLTSSPNNKDTPEYIDTYEVLDEYDRSLFLIQR